MDDRLANLEVGHTAKVSQQKAHLFQCVGQPVQPGQPFLGTSACAGAHVWMLYFRLSRLDRLSSPLKSIRKFVANLAFYCERRLAGFASYWETALCVSGHIHLECSAWRKVRAIDRLPPGLGTVFRQKPGTGRRHCRFSPVAPLKKLGCQVVRVVCHDR